jgi:ADP-dependent NAD(P)H-hydrate dehydratase
MSAPSEKVTPALLKTWGLPDPGGSKKSRGRVIVVGGSSRSPGAVLLSGEASLRVGAGRVGLAVPAPVQLALAPVFPEAAVFPLPVRATDAVTGPLRDEVAAADAVLVGPGFDDGAETRATVRAIAEVGVDCVILDAFALGVLPDIPRSRLPRSLILSPNEEEAAILLGRDLSDDRGRDVREIAYRYDAVVNCYGTVSEPSGATWTIPAGGPGLGTSGSGDVLAGAITGFAARGLAPARAAVWGSWVHARAGERLTRGVGIGFLARDIASELTASIRDAGL